MPRLNKTPDRNFILKHLYAGIVNFKFKKKDGEIREMNATLVTSQMDPRQLKESSPNPSDGDSNLIVCWDVDNNGWRSFNIDSLTEYTGLVRRV